MNFPATEPQTYRPKSNIVFSGSVRQKDEADYQECRQFLAFNNIALGKYLVDSYRELDQVSFSKKCNTPFKFQSHKR